MRPVFRPGWASALLLLCSLLAQAAEPLEESRRVFDRTAADTGRPYVVGRRFLESAGKSLLPLLNEKAKSADYRQRDLARILLLKIEDAKRFEALQKALEHGEGRLVLGDGGQVKVALPQGEEVAYDRAAIPAVVDYLHATADSSGSGPHERGWPRALQIMAHLADPDYAPTLVNCFHRQWRQDPLVEEALLRLGPAALPALRQAIKDAPTKQPEKADRADAAKTWRSMQRSCLAAKTLARLNDQASVPLLIDKLKASEYREQQSALAHALGRLGQRQAVPTLFDLTLSALRGGWDRRGYKGIEYYDARAAFLQLAPVAKEHLAEQSQDAQPLERRVVARGLAFEVLDPQAAAKLYESLGRTLPPNTVDSFLYRAAEPYATPPAKAKPEAIQPEEFVAAGRYWFWAGEERSRLVGNPLPDELFAPAVDLLVERALRCADPEDLERLARLRKPAWAFDVLLSILEQPHARGRGEAVARALAIWGDRRGADVLRKLVGQRDKVQPEALVEAALAFGNQQGLDILEEVLSAAKSQPALHKAAELAREVAPALQGDRPALVKLLDHPRPALGETAAWLLLRQGDTTGVGTLIGQLVQAQPDRGGHTRTRNELVRQGNLVHDALKQHAQKAANPAERVMAEAIALRITSPDLAAKFDRAISYRSRGFSSRAGPRVGDYRATGREIAARAGKEAVPLLEAEVVGSAGWGNDAVAAFALAVFKQKHSMDLLVGVLRDPKAPDYTRGLIAHAIGDFGDEGVAAIKDIPAPDPERPEFASRAGRFRGAAEALASIDPKTAAQNMVKGLTALAADSVDKGRGSGWSDRVRNFLRLAQKVEDPVIIAPILGVLKHDRASLEADAFRVLSRFEDPRLTEPALEALLNPASQRTESGTLLTLMRQLKDRTAARLVKELGDSKDAPRRAHAIEALAHLAGDYAPWYAIYRGKGAAADPRETEARKTSYAAAIEPLLAALDDSEPAVQVAAAKALPLLRHGFDLKSDDRPVKRLLAWLPKAGEIPRETVEFLVWTGHPDVKPALLKTFRERGRKDQAILNGFALGGWQWAEAVPEVYEGLKQVAKGDSWHALASERLHVLDRLGAEGWARLHDVIKDPQMPLHVRLEAARVLAGPAFPAPRPYPKAYDDVISLRDEIAKAGLDDPRLKTIQLYNAPRDDVAARQRYVVENLTLAAATLDPQRGYTMLMKLFPTLEDGEYGQRVTFVLERLQAAHAGAKKSD
jgi:HEAT repeat protein